MAAQLILARERVRDRINIDENTLIPAIDRYHGTLYEHARTALDLALDNQVHIIILSGGYGIVCAAEPIGNYDAVFNRQWWPKGLLENILAEYATINAIKHVRAFVSATTAYRKIIERVEWQNTGVRDVILHTPEPTTGAMKKAPRAQGQALAAYLRGDLDEDWRSSDGLEINSFRIA